MQDYTTQQEQFWAGEFGDDYIDRNRGGLSTNICLFSQILKSTENMRSVIELGANIGLNLDAINEIKPNIDLRGVEINPAAYEELRRKFPKSIHSSILDFSTNERFDLVFTKGTLIHLSPDHLEKVYDLVFQLSNRYILFCEYYNPTPVEVTYRGHSNKLFKRDFAGEFIDRHGAQLIDYRFIYHRDINFPQDDITWFLLMK